MDERHYRAVVIGAGQGGVPLAIALARSGWRTALVETQHVGGSCINYGCTPTKTMAASAQVAYLAGRAADYGVQAENVLVDMEQVRERKRAIVESFRQGSLRRIRDAEGLDLLEGEASFRGAKELHIDMNDGGVLAVTADNVFINTGARPRTVSLPGLDEVPALDSTSVMELDEVPEHLLILGGGYIGLEFGQMFRRFGSRVTIMEKHEQLAAREDADVAQELLDIFREDGIDVLLETKVRSVAQNAAGRVVLQLESAGAEQTLVGSHLLVAVGRVPNTDRLHLETAGVQVDDQGYIKVNERLETSVAGIWALGDVKGGPAFTHISYDDFRIIKTNLLEGGDATVTDRVVSYTIFTDPQLGRVGLSEQTAREQGRNIRVAKMPMSYVARALEVDQSRGLMKAVVDADTGQILGGAVLGIEGGEIMAILQTAMMARLPYTALRDAAFAHPTLAESLNNLFGSFEK